MQSVKILLRLF